MSGPKILKKGSRIQIPIKYDFKYKVLTPFGYEKPIERQDIYYTDGLLNIVYENSKLFKVTLDHRMSVLKDGKSSVCLAKDVKVGMETEMKDGSISKIKSITHEKYEGIACDFTMPNDMLFFDGIKSYNCRLRLDVRELRKKGGGLFGAGEKTGSIGVVTINLPKLGFLSKNKEDLFNRLEKIMIVAKDSLEIKRDFIEKLLQQGLYPYTKRYLDNFDSHFSTIGIVGMNECCLNFLGKDFDISTKEGIELSLEIMEFMNNKLSDFQEETRNLYNLESTPAESTCYRLAKKDLEVHPGIIVSGTHVSPYYTNSANLPVGKTSNIWEALAHQEPIQTKFTGGTVFHSYLEEGIDDWRVTKALVKNILTNSTIPYLTISPKFSICKNGHGYIKGGTTVCPQCHEEQKQVYTNSLKVLKKKLKNLE